METLGERFVAERAAQLLVEVGSGKFILKHIGEKTIVEQHKWRVFCGDGTAESGIVEGSLEQRRAWHRGHALCGAAVAIVGNVIDEFVGVVESVTPTQCTVSTILNPKVNVSAYEVRTRDMGFVTSTVALSKEGHCHMPGLSSSTAVTVGGIVCTSGVGGIFPRDLIIGNIVDVVDGTVDISASAIIEPGVDFSEITDVFIITDFDGQMTE